MQQTSLVTQLQNLVWPLACAGCGAWDVALCASCESLLYQPLRRIDAHHRALAGTMAVWARAAPAAASVRIANSYLRARRTDIGPLIAAAMRAGGDEFWARLAAGQDGLHAAAAQLARGGALHLVPVPPAAGQLRQVWALAASFAAGLPAGAAQLQQLFCRWPKPRVDGAHLRLRGAVASHGQVLLVAGTVSALLVRARELLRAHNLNVVGAIVFAAGVGADHGQ